MDRAGYPLPQASILQLLSRFLHEALPPSGHPDPGKAAPRPQPVTRRGVILLGRFTAWSRSGRSTRASFRSVAARAAAAERGVADTAPPARAPWAAPPPACTEP